MKAAQQRWSTFGQGLTNAETARDITAQACATELRQLTYVIPGPLRLWKNLKELRTIHKAKGEEGLIAAVGFIHSLAAEYSRSRSIDAFKMV